ncbi:CRISPR-associated regulatory protein, DevR family [Natronococcus jeotgali]|uniref:CRISPR-associated regulatory protein, DevR family n=1 Tax=Natronococcus jeotgali DSM 18795 TaxID=1227498 RepID=L9WWR1_9EURY|nr:CRISPR-associated regulatory protein, DevR family [Natronococcus jeotgali]ELY52778.1 CRISPR-associated regulatory protein, DevR family [Natronococcus jeotgali DSM 18795]
MVKQISFTSLTHGRLGNHNAGDSSGNTSTLKTYGNRPYISGQSFRHATRTALYHQTEDGVDCNPKHACGDIESCKICDLFGYMNMDLADADEDINPKRYSPLKVSANLGVYDTPQTSDLITQYDVDESENKMAHRQMTENVYFGAVSIDLQAIGTREKENVDNDKEYYEQYHRELNSVISDEQRTERAKELVRSIQHAIKFAGQARHMADFMPDLLLASGSDTYTHRLTNALHVSSDGELNINALRYNLQDVTNMGGEVWIGTSYNPEVITNWDEIVDLTDELDNVQHAGSVSDCYDTVCSTINNAM